MRLIYAYPIPARLFIILTTVILLTGFHMSRAQASMVIAPSKIVVNSNSEDSNFRKNRSNDNTDTVKAIIKNPLAGYNLADGFVVLTEGFSITMTFYTENTKGEITFEHDVDAFSIRYCYIDDNLIIEFDYDKIVSGIDTLNGLVNVDVSGFFLVDGTQTDTMDSASEIKIDLDETAAIIVYNPMVR